MFFKTLTGAGVAVALTLAASAASAATMSAYFDLRGSGGNQLSHSYSAGGIDLTVEAYQHNQGTLGNQIYVGRWGNGLGASFSGDNNHRVDGSGPDEIVTFDFSREVTIEKVYFSYYSSDDDFELGSYTGSMLDEYFSDRDIDAAFCSGSCNNGGNDVGVSDLSAAEKLTSSLFGIGSDHSSDVFKIRGVKVSYDVSEVPLPAGGVLLLSGLVGLAFARRRKN